VDFAAVFYILLFKFLLLQEEKLEYKDTVVELQKYFCPVENKTLFIKGNMPERAYGLQSTHHPGPIMGMVKAT
jgi:hypothetical protein